MLLLYRATAHQLSQNVCLEVFCLEHSSPPPGLLDIFSVPPPRLAGNFNRAAASALKELAAPPRCRLTWSSAWSSAWSSLACTTTTSTPMSTSVPCQQVYAYVNKCTLPACRVEMFRVQGFRFGSVQVLPCKGVHPAECTALHGKNLGDEVSKSYPQKCVM